MAISEKPQLSNTQELILDAAIRSVKQLGIERVTLNDIAKEANVARSTVYSYYTNKNDVVRFALLQSAYSFGEKVITYLADFETASERIVEGIIFGLRTLPNEPCLALITDSTLSQMLNEHALTTEAGFDINTAVVQFLIQDDSLDKKKVSEMAEFTSRTLFSLLAMQSPVERSDNEMRGFIARWLLPSLNLPIPAKYMDMESNG